MKKSLLSAIACVVVAGCSHTTQPASDTTSLPVANSQFVYEVDRPAVASQPAVRLQETAVVDSVTSTSFHVTRTSDTVNGFYTTLDIERYVLLLSGDLWPLTLTCDCDSTALPIITHTQYGSRSAVTPTKKNGVEADGFVAWHTQYDGMESVTAAGRSFNCVKVEKNTTVTSSSGDPASPVETITVKHIYWYSPDVRFFVKDQIVSDDSSSFTRTLVSWE